MNNDLLFDFNVDKAAKTVYMNCRVPTGITILANITA